MMFDVEKERETYSSPYILDVSKETYFDALNEIQELQEQLNAKDVEIKDILTDLLNSERQ